MTGFRSWNRRTILAAFVAFELGGAAVAAIFAAGYAYHAAGPAEPRWEETVWPFPLDPWGRGRAFLCTAADCYEEVTVLIRAKSGFCNCTTGIADDDELERVSDVELLGLDLKPRSAGRAVRAAGLDGRSRRYAGATRKQGIIATAFHSGCDAIVATAVAATAQLDRIEPAVMALLGREAVLRKALAAR